MKIHWQNVLDQKTSLQPRTLNNGFICHASFLNDDQWDGLKDNYGKEFTKSALLCIESIEQTIAGYSIDFESCMIILATTKGDIDLYPNLGLSSDSNERFYLSSISEQIDKYFKPKYPTIILSNACISGSQAIQLGTAVIRTGKAEKVIVCGVDIMSEFTLDGFNSLKALSEEPCKPFDLNRKGISLGEAASSILLSKTPDPFNDFSIVQIDAGIVTNDANHISGPSRYGEGLYCALEAVSDNFKIIPDIISLHGTGTIFNDDMESVALKRAGYDKTEAFGLKGNYGHTLGAAGILESVISLYALCHNTIPGTTSFFEPGTVEKINVSDKNILKPIETLFKCASGFGGGNCVLSFSKKSR